MKQSYIIIFAIITTIFLSSCEEIIKIDLNEANPKVVIEAIIIEDSLCTVNLSYSRSLYEAENSNNINNAIINLKSSEGESEVLQLVQNGFYKGSNILGKQDVTYDISIEIEGEVYEAESYLPSSVPIKDFVFLPQVTPERTAVLIQCLVDDPLNTDNYYKIDYEKITATENKAKGHTLFNDYGIDGIEITSMIFDFDLMQNDTVEINLSSMDSKTYNYLYQLDDIKNTGMGSSTPYNPESNFSNDCLGYFGAYSKDTKTIQLILPQFPLK